MVGGLIAHELGHGVFHLRHTFDDTAVPKGSSQNLMDYNNGTYLNKYQWDFVHNPSFVVGLFESDDAGAMKNLFNSKYVLFSNDFKEYQVTNKLNIFTEDGIKDADTWLQKLNDLGKETYIYMVYKYINPGQETSLNTIIETKLNSFKSEFTKIGKQNTNVLVMLNLVYDKQITNTANMTESFRHDFFLSSDWETKCAEPLDRYLNSSKRTYFGKSLNEALIERAKNMYDYLKDCKNLALAERLNVEGEWNAVQIKKAREDIEKITDENQKGDLFILLQKKVPYHNQTDNNQTTDIADRMCNLTSLASCFEMLGVSNPNSTLQFEDYLEKQRIDKKYEERTKGLAWEKLAKDLDIRFRYIDLNSSDKDFLTKELLPELRLGNGVILSISSTKGHIVRLQNITSEGLIVDDPYGELTDFVAREAGTGNDYDKNDRSSSATKGDDNLWTWDNLKKITIKYAYSFKP